MAIIIRPPARASRVIKRSEPAQATLDKLNAFIAANMDEPVKLLVRFWKDQQLAITFKELRSLVADGGNGLGTYKAWQQDYAKMLSGKMTDTWTKAFRQGCADNNFLDGKTYDAVSAMKGWVESRTTELCTVFTKAQHEAVRYVVAESAAANMSVAETARYIRPIIGLNVPQSKSNFRHYSEVKRKLSEEFPTMRPGTVEKKARESAAKYAEKQIRRRAQTIAQTELVTAYHEGNDKIVRDLYTDGYMPRYKKVVATSGDDRVCPACQALDGMEVEMDGAFVSGRISAELPPFHPNCGCGVMYEEIDEDIDNIFDDSIG